MSSLLLFLSFVGRILHRRFQVILENKFVIKYARPTWALAKGGNEQGGTRIFGPSQKYSSRDIASHTTLKPSHQEPYAHLSDWEGIQNTEDGAVRLLRKMK